MLKLKYFGDLMQTVDSLEISNELGKIEGRRRRVDRGWDGWMASPTQWTWVGANSERWWRTGKPGVLQSMGSQRVAHDWVTELNWNLNIIMAKPTGLRWWLSGQESACWCRRCKFNPWVGKIPLEKEMATHSSILVWEISWTEETGRLQSLGSQTSQAGLSN